jgi:hypothetical protein
MSRKRAPASHKPAKTPQASQNGAPVDPASQSPDKPIEFARGDEVARGNAERANAEPEPAALHDAQVPGKPDAAAERRHR